VSLPQENRLICNSLGLWRQVALERNHFYVLSKIFCRLHGGEEISIAADDDGGVIEVTECANNDVGGHHHVDAFFDHRVALTPMYSKFYLKVGRIKQGRHELVLLGRSGGVVRWVLANVVVVGALHLSAASEFFGELFKDQIVSAAVLR